MAPFVFVAALLAGVNFLPPDTSLREIQRQGTLRVCGPDSFPPLITGVPAAPGLEIELLRTVAERLGVRLVFSENRAIGRDFNPRNWRVTRAQCQLLAGGVVASPTTRSFLETTRPHLSTGWALVVPAGLQTLDGARVGFYAGVTGLDRLALSRYLREQGTTVQILNSRAALASALSRGEVDAGVTEALTARQVAAELGVRAVWLPEALGRYPIAFGLWKGDLTFKRRLEHELDALRADGGLAELIRRYDVAPIEATCGVCR